MADQLVLITGANGHIGFRVLVVALEAGYRVRAVVRSQEKADQVLSAPSIKALNPGPRLTFHFVPDLLQPGAYDEAIKDVDYAIHIASPITSGVSSDQYETHFMQPAVAGTLGILKSAQTSPSVKRVVITSSIAAIVPWHDFFNVETDQIFNEHSRTPDPTGPFESEFEAYAASKVRAFNATLKWMDEAKPAFEIVHVHPTFVVGRDELIRDAQDITKGTNGAAMRQVLGTKQEWSTPSTSVHLEDVAIAHVKALSPAIPAGYSLVTQSEGTQGTHWGDALDIVKRAYPKAVEAGVLPNDGFAPTKHTKVDASATAKLLGLEFKSYEEQVRSVAGHYLELVGVEAA
jgi:nucleoside-diphosphate-sugar epimerase